MQTHYLMWFLSCSYNLRREISTLSINARMQSAWLGLPSWCSSTMTTRTSTSASVLGDGEDNWWTTMTTNGKNATVTTSTPNTRTTKFRWSGLNICLSTASITRLHPYQQPILYSVCIRCVPVEQQIQRMLLPKDNKKVSYHKQITRHDSCHKHFFGYDTGGRPFKKFSSCLVWSPSKIGLLVMLCGRIRFWGEMGRHWAHPMEQGSWLTLQKHSILPVLGPMCQIWSF